MKTLFLSLLLSLLTSLAFAQLNTFKEGDVISAEQMNQNFEAILKKSMVVRSTTVDCDAGETINAALTDGYNDITIFGTCNEEIVAMSLFDGTAIDRQERFPSEPVGHIIITGGEDNRGAVLASQVSSAFQASLQLRNLTVTNRISVFANSFLFMRDVTHAVEPGNESKIRVAENSVIYIQESDLSEPVELHNGSTAMIHQVNLNVANDGQFFDVVRGSNLEVFDSTITHQSSEFSVSSLGQVRNAESLFRAVENSSIHVSGSTLKTTTSAAFVLDLGASLHVEDSTITSDSFISIILIGSQLFLENSDVSNTINEAIVVTDGSSGRIVNSVVSSSAGGQALSVNGSNLTILEGSIIRLDGTVDTAHEALYLGRGAFVNLYNSTIETTVVGDPNDDNYHGSIYLTQGSNLVVRNSSITSAGDTAIGIYRGSNVYIEEDGDSSDIKGGANSDLDIHISQQSSLFLDDNKFNFSIYCDSKGYVNTTKENSPNVSDECLQ